MNPGINASLVIIALSIYAVRLAPFIFLKGTIRSRFIRSFLYYVPYVTLAVMTFPAIITAAGNPLAGVLALAAGLAVAWIWGDLFAVACTCCAVVFVAGLFL
ncbi:MAG: AzlD domain-containing protein [Lachnospiraceae bacterium]|nr:AzlD domain-containing protein [Lachnospiraceae bacterium]MBQ6363018.1 AzlD domain-containing protein [Lachnospiraceae bacterium]MBR2995082.1 AzlD domain-containing protein [Lachnospiraceae bacterium]